MPVTNGSRAADDGESRDRGEARRDLFGDPISEVCVLDRPEVFEGQDQQSCPCVGRLPATRNQKPARGHTRPKRQSRDEAHPGDPPRQRPAPPVRLETSGRDAPCPRLGQVGVQGLPRRWGRLQTQERGHHYERQPDQEQDDRQRRQPVRQGHAVGDRVDGLVAGPRTPDVNQQDLPERPAVDMSRQLARRARRRTLRLLRWEGLGRGERVPEPLSKGQEFRRGLDVELISQQTLMSPQMLDGTGAVTRGRQRLDQTMREPRVVGVVGHKALPPHHSAGMFARCIGGSGERLQGLRITIRQAAALRVPPVLERRAGAGVKPF